MLVPPSDLYHAAWAINASSNKCSAPVASPWITLNTSLTVWLWLSLLTPTVGYMNLFVFSLVSVDRFIEHVCGEGAPRVHDDLGHRVVWGVLSDAEDDGAVRRLTWTESPVYIEALWRLTENFLSAWGQQRAASGDIFTQEIRLFSEIYTTIGALERPLRILRWAQQMTHVLSTHLELSLFLTRGVLTK